MEWEQPKHRSLQRVTRTPTHGIASNAPLMLPSRAAQSIDQQRLILRRRPQKRSDPIVIATYPEGPLSCGLVSDGRGQCGLFLR